jgi:hypothetical protein
MILKAHRFFFKAAGGLLILLLLVCCGTKPKGYIIPEKKFVALLVDLHIAESIGLQSRRNIDMVYEVDSASLYGSVFRKHNVTQAMFDSTLYFYTMRPEKFQKIYNSVTANLKHLEENIAEEQKQQELMENEVIWKSDTVYLFPQRGAYKIPINVPIKGPGIYTVSADVKILPDDISLDPRMSVYFYNNDSASGMKTLNTPDIRYTIRNGDEKTYRAVHRLMDSTFTSIRGFVATYSNSDTVFRRHMVVRNLKVTRKIMDQNPGAGIE